MAEFRCVLPKRLLVVGASTPQEARTNTGPCGLLPVCVRVCCLCYGGHWRPQMTPQYTRPGRALQR